MSKFDSFNRFDKNPVAIDIKRSQFNRDNSHKTTMVAGYLTPIFCDEVIPGDTFNLDVAAVVRSITPVAPVMDNSFIDIQFYFVPGRLCTKNEHSFEKVLAQENFSSYWAPATKASFATTGDIIQVNQIKRQSTGDDDEDVGIAPQSLANYLGLPILGTDTDDLDSDIVINTLPFIAYAKIWNEWFRDENVEAPITNFTSFITNSGYPLGSSGSSILPVRKFSDYYVSALPSPQKGDSVLLPLAELAPVVAGDVQSQAILLANTDPIKFTNASAGQQASITGNVGLNAGSATITSGTNTSTSYLKPSNLWADLSQVPGISVNDMRNLFALQRMKEKDARGGTRYREYLFNHFGVASADSRVQVPEFLFGKRIPLNITTVLQTSETNDTPLGDTGAFSVTSYAEKAFVKSFTEWGYIIGVSCVRTQQSYSQGIPRMFSRVDREEFYHPSFANIGEQPLFVKELYVKSLDGSAGHTNETVFGYQEAWADYRYKPNQVSGYLAPDAGDTVLSQWTYTTNFTAQPVKNADFQHQARGQLDNTFVVTNSVYQYICDFYFHNNATRVMPLFSIPGLLDHH